MSTTTYLTCVDTREQELDKRGSCNSQAPLPVIHFPKCHTWEAAQCGIISLWKAARKKLGDKWSFYRSLSWAVSVGCFRDVGSALARKGEESGIALVWGGREKFTIGKMDCLSERLRIICLMGQCRRAQRQNAQTSATEHCQLSATFPLSSTFLTWPLPSPPLFSVTFVGVSLEWLVLTWLTVWAKMILIPAVLAAVATVLLLEGPQNVPDIIFLYHPVVSHIIIV